MGIKLHEFPYHLESHEGSVWVFHCPGCGNDHPVEVPRWGWNGSLDHPTFMPSLLCNAGDEKSRCHSFIRDGQIDYMNDCWHELKGKTVEIPDWEEQSNVYKVD